MDKDTDLYCQLAKHLDRLPGGYPATESGVELRILRRLFSPQDAALARGRGRPRTRQKHPKKLSRIDPEATLVTTRRDVRLEPS